MAYSSQGGGRSASTPQQTKPAQAAKPAKEKPKSVFAIANISLDPVEHESLHEAMVAVSRDLVRVGVAKGTDVRIRGTDGKPDVTYQARGIQELMDSVGPVLAKHGVIVLPSFKIISTEKMQSKSGGTFFTRCYVEGHFCYKHKGEFIEVRTIGEANDYQDKAVNKAMSVATKYAHALTFSIPFAGLVDTEVGSKDSKEPEQPPYGTPGTQGVEGAEPYTEDEINTRIVVLRAAPSAETLRQLLVNMREEIVGRKDNPTFVRLREEYDRIREEKGWVNQGPRTAVDNAQKSGLFND